MGIQLRSLRAVLTVAVFAGVASTASAATISWTTWTAATTGNTTGSATGTIPGGIGVSYAGDVDFFDTALNWLPASSFTGGTVDNAPPSGVSVANDGVALSGGPATGTNVITFSTPVQNPILAIWSVGSPSVPAMFTFPVTQPFSIQGGGANSEFGGAAIFAGGTCPALSVCGSEGNGVVQFTGTFNSISWTNPLFENYYAFTVGVAGPGGPTVPEPASLALFSIGAGLAFARRRRARRG